MFSLPHHTPHTTHHTHHSVCVCVGCCGLSFGFAIHRLRATDRPRHGTKQHAPREREHPEPHSFVGFLPPLLPWFVGGAGGGRVVRATPHHIPALAHTHARTRLWAYHHDVDATTTAFPCGGAAAAARAAVGGVRPTQHHQHIPSSPLLSPLARPHRGERGTHRTHGHPQGRAAVKPPDADGRCLLCSARSSLLLWGERGRGSWEGER